MIRVDNRLRFLRSITDSLSVSAEPNKPNVGFVACIEGGVLEAQALLLFESIRHYAGRFRDCPIYALSPRSGHSISERARYKLDKLRVTYIDAVLNTECREYGSANRVAAAAYIEQVHPHEILVILDSDTLFLREPDNVLLPPDVDVAVRPVDVKGMCTAGSADPFDSYWRDLCRCCGVDYEAIPWTESFVDQHRIKASYNGGLVIVRGKLGILRQWADFFFASVRQRLLPYSEDRRFRSGAGWIESSASRLWGSNQAALSLAIWSNTPRVQELLPTYNYPLHLHNEIDAATANAVFPHLVHVHYHWLLEEKYTLNPLFDSAGPLSPRQRDWLGVTTFEQLREADDSNGNRGHRVAQAEVVELADNSRAAGGYSPPPICIAGMHRSGTSMVARLMHCCGVFLGSDDELKQPASDNPEGFWENLQFVRLNEDIIAQYGGKWDAPPAFHARWESAPELSPLRERADELIEEYRRHRRWGWKDPRNSLTLPFWQQVIPDIKVIVCVRNPLEVAPSLFARGDSIEYSPFELWLTYNRQILSAVPSERRLVTHYQSYFEDPGAELRRVLKWLDLHVSDEAISRACARVSASLRHYRMTTSELIVAGLPNELLDLYFRLCAEAGPVYHGFMERDPLPEIEQTAGSFTAKDYAYKLQLMQVGARLMRSEQKLRSLENGVIYLNTKLQSHDTDLASLRPVHRLLKALRAIRTRLWARSRRERS